MDVYNTLHADQMPAAQRRMQEEASVPGVPLLVRDPTVRPEPQFDGRSDHL